MDLLKKVLRQALLERAPCVEFHGGRAPHLVNRDGTARSIGDLIDQVTLQKLSEFLFPQNQAEIAAGQRTRGLLQVPNVGHILLIAEPGPPCCLRLYLPPEGPVLFEKDWARQSPNAAAPLFASGDAPTGADVGAEAVGGFIPPTLSSPPTAESGPLESESPPVREQPGSVWTPSPLISNASQDARIRYETDVQDGSISDGLNPIDRVLSDMVRARASDLHLTCGEPLCMRIDGDIVRSGSAPLDARIMQSYLEPIWPAHNQAEFAAHNDTDFAYEVRGVGRFRVNIFRDRNGVGAVLRHIPSSILTAEELKLPAAVTNFCKLHKGLVLVTGPTGSGKSTTLAAMIDLINKTRSDHILTIEDPIEFVHPQQRCLVNQREVHKHTDSFARALKAALREDPDIVLIGEMRDLETIAIALETAETGHLVFGTLHTTTAVSTIDRIIDQFPTTQQEQIRTMLAASLRGVVAQTLLKKIGGGRVAAHEILVTSDAVAAMIREGKNHMIQNHMLAQKADGNILLNESLLRLVKEGIVAPEEAIAKTVDKTTLMDTMRRFGIKGLEPVKATPATRQSA